MPIAGMTLGLVGHLDARKAPDIAAEEFVKDVFTDPDTGDVFVDPDTGDVFVDPDS